MTVISTLCYFFIFLCFFVGGIFPLSINKSKKKKRKKVVERKRKKKKNSEFEEFYKTDNVKLANKVKNNYKL